MRKKQQRRSNCPINYALETFGDTWSLLIVRDIVYFGKHTYCEFLDSKEGIATNILVSRLAHLEEKGILTKQPDAADKRKEIYSLTEKGLDLIPIMLDMVCWSAHYDPQTDVSEAWIAMVHTDREKLIQLIRDTVRRGGAILAGPDSVISQFALSKTGRPENGMTKPG